MQLKQRCCEFDEFSSFQQKPTVDHSQICDCWRKIAEYFFHRERVHLVSMGQSLAGCPSGPKLLPAFGESDQVLSGRSGRASGSASVGIPCVGALAKTPRLSGLAEV